MTTALNHANLLNSPFGVDATVRARSCGHSHRTTSSRAAGLSCPGVLRSHSVGAPTSRAGSLSRFPLAHSPGSDSKAADGGDCCIRYDAADQPSLSHCAMSGSGRGCCSSAAAASEQRCSTAARQTSSVATSMERDSPVGAAASSAKEERQGLRSPRRTRASRPAEWRPRTIGCGCGSRDAQAASVRAARPSRALCWSREASGDRVGP
jgi:hypothetical protein